MWNFQRVRGGAAYKYAADGLSQQLGDDGVRQMHVLRAVDRQPVDRVVVDQLRDARERLAVLGERVQAGAFEAFDFNMHKPPGAPGKFKLLIILSL